MIKLVAHHSLNLSDIQEELSNPKNRKKSANMIIANSLSKYLLEKINYSDDGIDIILTTGEGELVKTYDFYEYLFKKQRSSPTIFQSSLHNSTLGDLSLQISGIHSGITISNGVLSFEDAINLALNKPLENPLLILGIDIYPDELREVKKHYYGDSLNLIDGAVGAIFMPGSDKREGSIIKGIKYKKTNEKYEGDFFPTNGLQDFLKNQRSSSSLVKTIRPLGYSVEYYLENELN